MTTTNLPNGITNVADDKSLGSYTYPDPTKNYTFFDDFFNYTAGDWTITETGSGTRAVGNIAGGVLVITNAAADNDYNYLQYSGNTSAATVEQFKFVAGKPAWFAARVAVNDATESDLFVGLYVTDTDPITAIVDGVYFHKADGSTTVNLIQTKDSTPTTTAAGTMADATYHKLAWYYDGFSEMKVFFDDVLVATAVTTNIPDDEELSMSMAIQNGEAVAKSLSVDYLFASFER